MAAASASSRRRFGLVSTRPRLDLAFGDIGVPLRLRRGETEPALIGTKTTFGTAVDVTVAGQSIGSFFPAGPRTAHRMPSLLGGSAAPETPACLARRGRG
ncbi:MAG TPA: hypothetical protein VK585_13475 [Jiangellaceae bacterium]|nr:hypothetical protein [Jiangellaceae bacterium]